MTEQTHPFATASTWFPLPVAQGHYGVSQWNGAYHLFYQYNPEGTFAHRGESIRNGTATVSQPEKVGVDIVEDYQRPTTTTKSAP